MCGTLFDVSGAETNEAARALEHERWEILTRLEDWLELPMLILGFVWLALLVLEFVWGENSLFTGVGTMIWILFVLDFTLKFTLAPAKGRYLRRNWLTAVSLLVPALRVFRVARVVRVLRAARAARGLRLVRVVTSINRGMRALSATMSRRGFGYVVLLTTLVTFAGAAGMYAFENGLGLDSYGTALWWTAMLMTTLGSEYWPQTVEGRILTFILSLYAFGVFGYVAATLASFFIGRDAENNEGEVAGSADIAALGAEIAALRAEIRALRGAPEEG